MSPLNDASEKQKKSKIIFFIFSYSQRKEIKIQKNKFNFVEQKISQNTIQNYNRCYQNQNSFGIYEGIIFFKNWVMNY